jgi:hypothetical protein
VWGGKKNRKGVLANVNNASCKTGVVSLSKAGAKDCCADRVGWGYSILASSALTFPTSGEPNGLTAVEEVAADVWGD